MLGERAPLFTGVVVVRCVGGFHGKGDFLNERWVPSLQEGQDVRASDRVAVAFVRGTLRSFLWAREEGDSTFQTPAMAVF